MSHPPSCPPPGPGAASAPGARSLGLLRGLIDEVDRDVLRLLARRNTLVGEIAAWKREHRAPIRDPAREREILDDRCDRAAGLGLAPPVIESIFRLVLAASRERQAELRAEVPPEVEPKMVAIIGGKGSMGRCIGKVFADLGHTVLIADLDTALTPEDAAAAADVVVISVPIDATIGVIRRVGPHVRPSGLLMDLTSIKSAPVEAMLASTEASVIGTHPLFGPSVHTVQGQRIVLTPARPGAWLGWLRTMMHARGLEVRETTPEAHDRAMAIVQVLTHFSTEVMGRTLADLKAPIEETLAYTSPIYLMELLMTARHFAQSAELYASIQMSNPATADVTRAFVDAAERLRRAVTAGDRAAFGAMFDEVRGYFGPFGARALEQSGYLIDRLVERA